MQNSTCEWCITFIFWPIVYLHMRNHYPETQGCTPSGSILKIFYFPQYFPVHSIWSKNDFYQNWNCELCTTMIFSPIIYLHITNQCPKSQDYTASGSILKKIYFPQYFPIHSEWCKTDFLKNWTCKWCTTLVFLTHSLSSHDQSLS